MTTNPQISTLPSVSFVVLALNEEADIETSVNMILAAVKRSTLSDYEIVLVDDGSTDATGEIMERLAASNSRFKVTHNERNLGLGGAYKRGLALASCEYVMIVAGDNAIPLSDMSLLLEQIGKADIILPYVTNRTLRPLVRRITSWGYSTIINLLFGLRIHYYNGMLPRRQLLNQITITTDSYAFQAEAVVKLIRAGATYFEIGLPNTPCGEGRSVALEPKRLLAVLKGVFNLAREIWGFRRFQATPTLELAGSPKKESIATPGE